MSNRIVKRIPKTSQEMERFCLDVINKLQNTFVTLEDVETLMWALHNYDNPRAPTEGQIAADLAISLLDFVPSHQQEIRDVEQLVYDTQTLYWMEA